MHESRAELAQLQGLLDSSFAGSGDHLRSAFSQDQRLSAQALVDAFDGLFEIHLAVLAGDGAPLVAPVDAVLFRGHLWIGLPRPSLRSRLVRRDPRVSASFSSGELAMIVHGVVREVGDEHPHFGEYVAVTRGLYVAQYGEWFGDWFDKREATEGPGFTGVIEPRVLFAKGGPQPEE